MDRRIAIGAISIFGIAVLTNGYYNHYYYNCYFHYCYYYRFYCDYYYSVGIATTATIVNINIDITTCVTTLRMLRFEARISVRVLLLPSCRQNV